MKKILVLFYGIISTTTGMAQPAYPLPPGQPANLSRLEYYFDTDPGQGNGRPVATGAVQQVSSFSFNADVTGLPAGFHRLYVRTMNENGKWSITSNSFFDNVIVSAYPLAPSPAANITSLEYFIDTDPGEGNGHTIPVVPATEPGNESLSVNVSGLSAGVHRLYIRSKDANGKWSLTNFSIFDNSVAAPYPAAPPPAPVIGEIEYYIDTDPGWGNGTPVTFTSGFDISNLTVDIPLSTVAQGAHTIYFRSRQNPWSLSAYAEFLYGSVLPVTWLYVKGSIEQEKTVLSWATALEQNTDRFVVEYSTDGTHYTSVGEVAAAGSSSTSRPYSFVHTQPGRGFLYYRIRQVDLDGKFTYSKTIQLFNSAQLRATVIGPNPAHHTIYIMEPEPVLMKKMEIYDMTGRLILSRKIETINKAFSFQLGNIPGGTYLLSLHYQDKIQTFKIVKE